jgi:hypothetical protein
MLVAHLQNGERAGLRVSGPRAGKEGAPARLGASGESVGATTCYDRSGGEGFSNPNITFWPVDTRTVSCTSPGSGRSEIGSGTAPSLGFHRTCRCRL